MTEIKEKKYYNDINIMRGMAVLCVVIGHSFNATDTPTFLGFLKSFVYCFHMPAFFFISGFLVKKQSLNWNTKLKKIAHKAKRLMVPYLFLTVVSIGLKVLFGVFARNPLNYNTLLIDILVGRNNPNGGLWFLYALFVISLMGILLNEIDCRIMLSVTFVLYMINVFAFQQSDQILGYFVNYAWFYFGGTVVREHFYELIINSKLIRTMKGRIITVLAVVLYVAVAFYKIYYLNSWWLSCLVTILGIFWLFVIAAQADMLVKGKKIWMILGKYGMDIYMIGYYIQQAVYVILGEILEIDYLIYAWCMCIFGIIAPILISKYIVRKNNALSLLILGR